MSSSRFKIDLTESFEHLPHAPIVEAVIHWRARAEKKLEPDELLEQLKEKLPDYPSSQRQQDLGIGSEFRAESSKVSQHLNWHGFRFEAVDKLQVAQFTRNGFVFSRLEPYEDWEKFEAEARRLWQIYCDLSEPSEIQRLGVRFINLITPVKPDELPHLLAIAPHSPERMQLPQKGFMHQSTFEIPGHPYNLNVIQTIQPSGSSETESFNLIIDLDVFTTRPIQFDEIENRLLQMQWIKNKAFFSFLTKAALARFREQTS